MGNSVSYKIPTKMSFVKYIQNWISWNLNSLRYVNRHPQMNECKKPQVVVTPIPGGFFLQINSPSGLLALKHSLVRPDPKV